MIPGKSAYTSPSMDNVAFVAQMQGMSLQQEAEITPNHALFSWMEGDDIVLNNDVGAPKDGTPIVHSDYNLHSKMHLNGEATRNTRSVPINSSLQPPVASFTYPKKEFIPYKPKEPKVFMPLVLDVSEQLNKALAHVSLWDLLSIPKQKSRLREALSYDQKEIGAVAPPLLQMNGMDCHLVVSKMHPLSF